MPPSPAPAPPPRHLNGFSWERFRRLVAGYLCQEPRHPHLQPPTLSPPPPSPLSPGLETRNQNVSSGCRSSCQIRRAWFLTNVSIPPQLGSTRFCSSQLQAKKCSFGQFAFNEAANLVRNIKHIITQAGVRPQALGVVYSYFFKCAIISNRIL